MNSPPLPDVLFLRPKNEEPQSVETREKGPINPDVVFASSRPAIRESQAIPTPHTRFAPPVNSPMAIELPAIEPETVAVTETPRVETTPENPAEVNLPADAPVNGGLHGSDPVPEQLTPEQLTPEHELPTLQPARPSVIQPSWLVDHFQWNPIVARLAKNNQPALARLAKEVLGDPASTNGRPPVLAVAGLGRCVGTTTISQLAIQWLRKSAENKTALPFEGKPLPSLLLDASLWAPSLAQQIGLRCRRCWADIPEDFDSLGEAIIADSRNQIHVMPLNCVLQSQDLDSRRPPSGTSSYSIPAAGLPGLVKRLEQLVAAVKSQYQQIVIDLGDLDAWLSYRAIDELAPEISNLLIVHQPPISRRQFSHTYWSLHDLGLQNIHVLENTVTSKPADH